MLLKIGTVLHLCFKRFSMSILCLHLTFFGFSGTRSSRQGLTRSTNCIVFLNLQFISCTTWQGELCLNDIFPTKVKKEVMGNVKINKYQEPPPLHCRASTNVANYVITSKHARSPGYTEPSFFTLYFSSTVGEVLTSTSLMATLPLLFLSASTRKRQNVGQQFWWNGKLHK